MGPRAPRQKGLIVDRRPPSRQLRRTRRVSTAAPPCPRGPPSSTAVDLQNQDLSLELPPSPEMRDMGNRTRGILRRGRVACGERDQQQRHKKPFDDQRQAASPRRPQHYFTRFFFICRLEILWHTRPPPSSRDGRELALAGVERREVTCLFVGVQLRQARLE